MTDDYAQIEEDLQNQRREKVRVIIPPPDIKTVVDKTASYVQKKGRAFEEMIMKVEAMNPKFNFLRHEDDPYRPYYLQKLDELANGGVLKEEIKQGSVSTSSVLAPTKPRENPYQRELRELIYSGDPDDRKKQGDVRPYAPDQYTISHPILANIDSDIIKLTA